jgi:hypothetical protein
MVAARIRAARVRRRESRDSDPEALAERALYWRVKGPGGMPFSFIFVRPISKFD